MNAFARSIAIAIAICAPISAMAEDIEVGQPASITAEPAKFELAGKRARQQLIVTGNYSNNEVRDLTPAVTFASSNPAIVKIEGSVALQ